MVESYGNDNSDATIPKSVGGTSKRTDFCDSGGKVLLPIAKSLSYI